MVCGGVGDGWRKKGEGEMGRQREEGREGEGEVKAGTSRHTQIKRLICFVQVIQYPAICINIRPGCRSRRAIFHGAREEGTSAGREGREGEEGGRGRKGERGGEGRREGKGEYE